MNTNSKKGKNQKFKPGFENFIVIDVNLIDEYSNPKGLDAKL